MLSQLSLILFLLLMPFLPCHGDEGTRSESIGSEESQVACMHRFRKYKCHTLLQSEVTAKTVNQCDGSAKSLGAWDWTKTCLSQGAGIWGESIAALQKAPEAIINSVAQRLREQSQPRVALARWKSNCRKNKDCIARLIQASQQKRIPREELAQDAGKIHRKIKSKNPLSYWRGNQQFNYYYDKTAQRNFLRSKDSWYAQEMRRTFSGTQSSRRYPTIVETIRKQVDAYHKLNCLKPKEQTEARCYLFFSIADPTAAIAIAKIPKVAKLLKEIKKSKTSKPQKTEVQEKKPQIVSQPKPKKKLVDMSDEDFVEDLAQLDNHDKITGYINKLSNEDLVVFAKKVDPYSPSSKKLIESKNYDQLKQKMSSDNVISAKIENFARPHMARINKKRNLGLPPGKVATSTDGRRFSFVDDKGIKRGSARVNYEPGNKQLYIDKRETQWRDSSRGIQQAIFKSILEKYPDTRNLRSVFVRSNADTIKEGMDRGLSFEEAVKLSPAYKIAEKNGFTKVKQVHSRSFEAIFSKD